MPELPRVLADIFTAPFNRPIQVAKVVDLDEKLRRVHFRGSSLKGLSFRPGQEIEFRVSDTSFRHYTPASLDPEKETLEVIFFLHGLGPGSAWAKSLQQDQTVNLLGPGGKFCLRPGGRHLFLGDESTLGLFQALQHAAKDKITGILETDASQKHWPNLLGLRSLKSVQRGAEHGQALLAWVEQHFASQHHDDSQYYIVGHAQSVVSLRRALKAKGCKRSQIHTKIYWASGKRGL